MSPTARQISENVVVLMHRMGINNSELAAAIGINRMPLGHRITGRTEWRAEEIERVAQYLRVTPTELMNTIPPYKEWERRTSQPRARVAAPGPRFLTTPEAPDGLSPSRGLLNPVQNAASDIMSVVRFLAALLGLRLLPSARANTTTSHIHRMPFPHTAQRLNTQLRRRGERLTPPVRRQSLTTSYSSHVPLTRSLTRNAQHSADLRPRTAVLTRRSNVQNHCTFQLVDRVHHGPEFG